MKNIAKRVVVYKGFIIKVFRDNEDLFRDKYNYSWEVVAFTENAKNRMRYFSDNTKHKELKVVDIFLYVDVTSAYKSAKNQVDSLLCFYMPK